MKSSTYQPIQVAIVGTGYIAEFHARAIRQLDGVKLVCVCDSNLQRATAFAQTWGAPAIYESLEKMLGEQTIDVVHLLVPPNHHYALAKQALSLGTHVLLEKPMCEAVEQADELLALAKTRDLHLGVSHNFMFFPAYARLREAIASNVFGSIQYICLNHFFELQQIRFGPFDSWMLRKPGNAILETGPHPLSAMLDMVGEANILSVNADRKFMVPGGATIYRRWRVRANAGRTAIDLNIDFGPGFPQRTIYVRGLFASAALDFDANTCVLDRHESYDLDYDRFKRSRLIAKQHRSQGRYTIADYVLTKLKLRKRGNPFQISIIDSVASFYAALKDKTVLDARIDGRRGRATIDYCNRLIQLSGISNDETHKCQRGPLSKPPTVLVLGGTGFIARELVRQLIADGYSVRAMIRGSSALLEEFDQSRLEIIRGDVRNKFDLEAALPGIKLVYHLAHSPGKTWDDYLQNEVEPARLIGETCLEHGVERLIYTGTIASYYTGSRAATITESTSFDEKLTRRGYYSRAKAKSESILMDLHRTRGLPVVVFRPGIVIGKGGTPFHWGVGRFSEDICEVWGDGNHKLPFVLVEDVAAALVRGAKVQGIEGRSYNLVDVPLLSANEYLAELQKRSGLTLRIVHRPIWQFFASDMAKWIVKVGVRHPDRARVPSYKDWESRTHRAMFDCALACTDLEWRPTATVSGLLQGIEDSLAPWRDAIS